jgi:hypothetical protein
MSLLNPGGGVARLEHCMLSLSPVEIVFLEDNNFAGWLAVVGAVRSHGPQHHKQHHPQPNANLHPPREQNIQLAPRRKLRL